MTNNNWFYGRKRICFGGVYSAMENSEGIMKVGDDR